MITAFEIMTSGNRLKFVLVSCAVWIVLSLEGAEGTNIGGDEARFRRRRDNNESDYGYNNGDAMTTCNCASQTSTSRLTCKTPNLDIIDTGCEPGEVHLGDSCYRFVTRGQSRDESVLDCIQHNSHLVYIETSQEQVSLTSYMSDNNLSTTDYWLGLVSVDVTYIWMSGTAESQEFFTVDEDDGGNCVYLKRHMNSVNIMTDRCSKSKRFICEKDQTTGVDQCQSSIPNDLIQLSKSGSRCIDPDYISWTPILRGCDARKNFEGCSCYRDAGSGEPIQCGCGYCKLYVYVTEDDRAWPSAFSCNCSIGMADANFTISKESDDTAFTCSPGRPPSTTPAGVSQFATDMPSTSTGTTGIGPSEFVTRTSTTTRLVSSSTTGERGTVASVASNGGAVAAGVILAVVFLVGLLVVVFFVWRRKRSEKKSERSDKSPAAKNPYASGHPETVNPTYGLDELDLSKQSDLILKPVQGVGFHAVRNPTYDIGDEKETPNDYTYIKSPEDKRERNTYTDVQPRGYEAYRPNHQPDPYTAIKGTNESDDPATYTPIPDTAGESYATIASSGYTAYNPTKQDEGVYTDPLSTRDTDDDDHLVYNDRSKPAKKVTNDVDNEYVGLGDVPTQRHATAAATKILSAPGASGDSDYVDVDAKELRVLKPTVSPRKKGGENVNLEASTGDGNYVSVDAPTSQGNQGDELSTTEDHTYNSLGVNARKGALGQGITDDPDNNTYNTVDRTHKRQAPKSVGQSPAQGNTYGKVNVKDDNAYDAFNRTGGGVKYPTIAADDGDYSLTVPPRDDTYNSFDRSHGRNKKPKPSDQVSQNDYGSLANNDDSEYATFD